MPGTTTKTVGPAHDYSSLSAFEAGEQADLPTLDKILQAECYSFEDTTRAVFDGWTTDATRYIRIFTPASERHDGKWNESKYRLRVTTGFVGFFEIFNCFESFTRVEGLQFSAEPDVTSNNRGACIFQIGALQGTRFSHNVVRLVPSTGTGYFGVKIDFTNGPAYAWNNVIYQTGGTPISGSGGLFHETGNFDHVAYFYNNTVYGWGTGFPSGGGNPIVIKNNLANGNTTDYADTYDGASVGNLSEDASSPNAALRNLAVTFVDEAGFDLHIGSGDTTGAKDGGTDLSADANLPFSDDIDGQTRVDWGIGADEFIAGGATSVVGGIAFSRRVRRAIRR